MTEIECLGAYYDETDQSEALAHAVPEASVTEVLVSTSIRPDPGPASRARGPATPSEGGCGLGAVLGWTVAVDPRGRAHPR
jgi:hypothetical protein